MKRFWLIAVVELGLVLSSGCGCGSGVSGRYVDSTNAASYVELHSDGTFFSHSIEEGYQTQYVSDVSGTYRLQGNNLELSTATGLAQKFPLRGNSLVDGSHTFVKQ